MAHGFVTNLRCSNPACGFQAHPDPEFGSFCCRMCHKVWAENLGTAAHGKQCKQVPVDDRCKKAPIQEPERPMTKVKRRVRGSSPVVPKVEASSGSQPARPLRGMLRGGQPLVEEAPAPKRSRLGQLLVERRAAERSPPHAERRAAERSPPRAHGRKAEERAAAQSSALSRATAGSHSAAQVKEEGVTKEKAHASEAGSTPLLKGRAIKARWRNLEDGTYGKKWYNGVFRKMNSDGDFEIKYQDGSVNIADVEHIRLEDGTPLSEMVLAPTQQRPSAKQELSSRPLAKQDLASDYYSSDSDEERCSDQEETARETAREERHVVRPPGIQHEPFQRSEEEDLQDEEDNLEEEDEEQLELNLRVSQELALVMTFLLQRRLLSYLRPLQDCGLQFLSDFKDISERDVATMGMTAPERQRFWQGVHCLMNDEKAAQENEQVEADLEGVAVAEDPWSDEQRREFDARLPEEDTVPPFSRNACGTPADWNRPTRTISWGVRVRHCFPPIKSQVNVHKFIEFLSQRRCGNGRAASDCFREPEINGRGGWFRLPWADFNESILPARAPDANGVTRRAVWEQAWHGTKIEALYSTICHEKLLASKSSGEGHRFDPDAPGVYLYPFKEQACQFSQFVPLCRDGVFWAAVWEVRTNRSARLAAGEGDDTTQWVQPEASVQLEALWLCGRAADCITQGDEVLSFWDPLFEANPHKHSTSTVPRRPGVEARRGARLALDTQPQTLPALRRPELSKGQPQATLVEEPAHYLRRPRG